MGTTHLDSLDLTGDLTVAGTFSPALDANLAVTTLAVGGGYADTGTTITAAGVITSSGAATFDGATTMGSAVIGGGYGDTGASISGAGVGQFNGALTTDGALTGASAVIGGGFGSSGVSISAAGVISADAALVTSAGVGAGVTGVVATEYGDGVLHKTLLTFTLTGANDIDVADGGKTTGLKIYDFPAGYIHILGATADLSIVTNNVYNASTNDVYYVGIGTADGTQAADADLTSTEQDIIAKTTLDTVSSTTLTLPLKAAMATGAAFDGTGTAVDLYLNVAVPGASATDATTHAVTGTLTVLWANLGDY